MCLYLLGHIETSISRERWRLRRNIGSRSGGSSIMATGTVKWFNEQKGYGFVAPDDGGEDLFVHYSNIQMDGFRVLREGQKVEYDTAEGRKGMQAVAVRAS